MKKLLFIPLLIFILFGTSSIVEGQDIQLSPDYVMCEVGGQLTWFLGFSGVSDLFSSDYSSNKYTPDDRVPISKNNKKASKALINGWCVATDNMSNYSVKILENCTEGSSGMPLPNGGCRRIQVSPTTPQGGDTNWTTWYTFGDAIIKN